MLTGTRLAHWPDGSQQGVSRIPEFSDAGPVAEESHSRLGTRGESICKSLLDIVQAVRFVTSKLQLTRSRDWENSGGELT
jgi:hypothetical protein